MAVNPILLVLGSGPRIGASIVKKFVSDGYSVAVASRNGTNAKTADGVLSLKADLTKPESVTSLFDQVQAEFHAPPSVVVYNASAYTTPPVKDSIFSIPTESVVSDLNVNTVSAYVAAQQAVGGWSTLPKDTKKTFIYTGNILNVLVLTSPAMTTPGLGKSAAAYLMGVADISGAAPGSRFFYADERYEDGALKGGAVDGDAHADFYFKLANHEGDVPWHATFVKDKGYVKFN